MIPTQELRVEYKSKHNITENFIRQTVPHAENPSSLLCYFFQYLFMMGLSLFVLKVNNQLGAHQPVHLRKDSQASSAPGKKKKPTTTNQRNLRKETLQHLE